MEVVINQPTIESYIDIVKKAAASVRSLTFPDYGEMYGSIFDNVHGYIGNCSTVEGLKDFALKYFRAEDTRGSFNLHDSVIALLSENYNLRCIQAGDPVFVISDVNSQTDPLPLIIEGVHKTNRMFMFKRSDGSHYYLKADEVISESMFDCIKLLIAYSTERLIKEDEAQKRMDAFKAVERMKMGRVRRAIGEVLLSKLGSDFTKTVEDLLIGQKPNLFKQILVNYIKINPFLRIQRTDPRLGGVKLCAVKKDMSKWVSGIRLVNVNGSFYVKQRTGYGRDPVNLDDYIFLEQSRFEQLEKLALKDTKKWFGSVVEIFGIELLANSLGAQVILVTD